ncbi:hypothetical protein GCM10009425_47040 [Pseudomonas asuensis]|uniref:Uncharacterized protein n=1 Tax=Pseudomonas asuensis TaxID=1825787 RepID=A0ABQ2H4V0_9PSED|nr:hypothetical protein GCM10009425_47040 [Pseudomonas asuensis]
MPLIGLRGEARIMVLYEFKSGDFKLLFAHGHGPWLSLTQPVPLTT